MDMVSEGSGDGIPNEMEIDGVMRATRNSKGQLIHNTEEGIHNFYKWFSDSRVTDKLGRPMVVYHGTNAGEDFHTFNTERGRGFFPDGASFHTDPHGASSYAVQGRKTNARVISAYISIRNPAGNAEFREAGKLFGRDALGADIRIWMKGKGYDGFHLGGDEWLVFDPIQIKSAMGNSGKFSSSNANIMERMVFLSGLI